MAAVKAIPDGYHSISAALTCKNASKAIDFYKKVFGGQELARMGGPGGLIMHAELKIGDSRIFLNDEIPGMATAPSPGSGNPIYLFLYTENVDKVYDAAVAEGCKVAMPLKDQFWGDRYGQVEDPYGHQWAFATHKQDLTGDQIAANAKTFFANMAKKPAPEMVTA